MTRRKTTDEEQEEFQRAFDETRPLKPPKSGSPARAARAPGATGGLDGSTAERLRRGAVEPQARLDLHGYTEDQAHRALLLFLRSAKMRGLRLVLVVTGKGRATSPDEPFDMSASRGALKASVPRWLKEPGFAALIAGAQGAHRRHGGAGALYIYLRKDRP